MLTSAGVVDTTGMALHAAASQGRESSVEFLLRQWERNRSDRGAAYLDTVNRRDGTTPMVCGIGACRSSSPRIARLLIDYGADTASAVRLRDYEEGCRLFFNDTPLAFTNFKIHEKKTRENSDGERATRRQMHSLEATRRLLMRVEAVHAVSWMWPSSVPSATHAAVQGTGNITTTPSPLTPKLWRRVPRPRVLLAAMFRWAMRDANLGR